MIGAIIGDISGSRFERYNHKSKDFVFFDKKCHPTDDSIMSLAVAKAILMSEDNIDCLSENAISCMQELGRIYKNAGYGKTFNQWIVSENPLPYNSYGNGSAMRVSPCGFAAESIEKAKELSALVTKVSHDHPEGMKGAEAIAVAVYLAKIGTEKEAIRKHIENYYYDLDFTLQEIQTTYKFDVSCQGSVPVALEAFFESTDFEDAIRLAISVGGDSDTIAAMAGAVAEAYYGVPNDIIYEAIDYLDSREMEILYYFEKQYPSKAVDKNGQPTISVFDVLDAAVDKIIPEGSDVQVAEEFSDGSIRILVDNNMLQPDFTSFDNKSEDAIDPYLGEDRRGEGYAFLWRKNRFRCPVNEYGKEIRPRIYRQYKTDASIDELRLIRDPGYGRFEFINMPNAEIRLITTHIIYGKPKADNLKKAADIGSTTMRKKEFNVLARSIYTRISEDYNDINCHVPYTIILGDYNLNLNKSGAGSPYVPGLVVLDRENNILPVHEISERGVYRIHTSQKDLSTINDDGTGYANNYDHFSYDDHTKDSIVINEPYRLGVVEQIGDHKTYMDSISDHIPIMLEIDFK